MMYIDPLAIIFAIVFIVGCVLIGSRLFPLDMPLHLWHYDGPRDRPSPEVREDDDVRFSWGQHTPGDGDDR